MPSTPLQHIPQIPDQVPKNAAGSTCPEFFRTSRSLKHRFYGGLVTRTIRLYASFERFGLSVIVGMVETYSCSC
jgi:hypothetical protein